MEGVLSEGVLSGGGFVRAPLDAPYSIMLFWFILLLIETQILTKLTPARQY